MPLLVWLHGWNWKARSMIWQELESSLLRLNTMLEQKENGAFRWVVHKEWMSQAMRRDRFQIGLFPSDKADEDCKRKARIRSVDIYCVNGIDEMVVQGTFPNTIRKARLPKKVTSYRIGVLARILTGKNCPPVVVVGGCTSPQDLPLWIRFSPEREKGDETPMAIEQEETSCHTEGEVQEEKVLRSGVCCDLWKAIVQAQEKNPHVWRMDAVQFRFVQGQRQPDGSGSLVLIDINLSQCPLTRELDIKYVEEVVHRTEQDIKVLFGKDPKSREEARAGSAAQERNCRREGQEDGSQAKARRVVLFEPQRGRSKFRLRMQREMNRIGQEAQDEEGIEEEKIGIEVVNGLLRALGVEEIKRQAKEEENTSG